MDEDDDSITEECEHSWNAYLKRFDTVIYPTLFEKRGYTKGEANIIWMLSRLCSEVAEVHES